MKEQQIAAAYSLIVEDLNEHDVALVWAAALFRRIPEDNRLSVPIAQLNALRDDVGKRSPQAQRDLARSAA